MKELSFNNALLKKEEEERKRLLEKKIKRGYGVSKPAMLSKGKFMLNSDARAAKHQAQAGLGMRILESRGKAPTETRTNKGGSPVRVCRELSPKNQS